MRLSCPNCGSLPIHRSRKKEIFEYVLSGIIFVHPFRCDECDSRFFRWSLCEKPDPPRPILVPNLRDISISVPLQQFGVSNCTYTTNKVKYRKNNGKTQKAAFLPHF